MTATRAPAGAAPVVVLKLGGDVLEGERLARVADDVGAARARVTFTSASVSAAAAAAAGADAVAAAAASSPPVAFVIVHGGGPQATALGERLGLPVRIVGGRRITDAPTLDVMKMVVAGKLDVDLCAALRAVGVPAVGVAGASGLVRAHRRPPRVVAGGGSDPIDFGLVGDIDGFDVALLRLLAAGGYLPVVAALGVTDEGEVLNINADVVASQLAAALGADALVAVTAVGGVRRDKDDPATRIARLTVAEARAAIAAGVVQGGMIPKLEEAFAPLEAGVAAVHIVAPGEIATSLGAPGSAGTLLVP